MSNLTIKAVDTNELQEDFLIFPKTLYRDCPYWVPPNYSYEKQLAGFTSHPFYERAESQAFVAMKDGVLCGRILAIINHAHNDWFGERFGFFGFFESINDQGVSNGLLDSVVEWLRDRQCQMVRGPVSPAVTYQGGLLVDKFDQVPTFLMPYNPRYYIDLIEEYGFQKSQNILSYSGHVSELDRVIAKFRSTSEMAVERFNVTMRAFDIEKIDDELSLFYNIYNRSLKNMWGYSPVSDAEIEYAGQSWGDMIVPEFTSVAEIDGEPVAVSIGLLDFNQLIQKEGEGVKWDALIDVKKIKRLQIPYALVLPKYRLWGLGPAVLYNMLDSSLEWGIEEVEFAWIAESNQLSSKTLIKGGAKTGAIHRIYDLPM